ncbi:hypothetical protein EDD18DRAFT_1336925 [Armillaria luteobubalina]|uniref:Uncharacterized protein n=1 Tax=Armillaria luteobubalina TaxID=153913 RepID=A0AA39PD13_9AGAR|nr:hypothetical protein EDD18DRAFT_1336925 [Armillaria luteobubalina]
MVHAKLTSNTDSPRNTGDWEILGSEIIGDTYELIGDIGFDNVRMMWESALKYSLDHREAMMLVYQGEVLDAHLAVTDRVNAWLNKVPVVHNRAPPVHVFDSERRLLAILNNTPHIPVGAPDDAPTLDPDEYCKWTAQQKIKRHRENAMSVGTRCAKTCTTNPKTGLTSSAGRMQKPSTIAPVAMNRRKTYTTIRHRPAHRGWRRQCQAHRTLKFNLITSANHIEWPPPCELLHFLPPGPATRRAGLSFHTEGFAEMVAGGQKDREPFIISNHRAAFSSGTLLEVVLIVVRGVLAGSPVVVVEGRKEITVTFYSVNEPRIAPSFLRTDIVFTGKNVPIRLLCVFLADLFILERTQNANLLVIGRQYIHQLTKKEIILGAMVLAFDIWISQRYDNVSVTTLYLLGLDICACKTPGNVLETKSTTRPSLSLFPGALLDHFLQFGWIVFLEEESRRWVTVHIIPGAQKLRYAHSHITSTPSNSTTLRDENSDKASTDEGYVVAFGNLSDSKSVII